VGKLYDALQAIEREAVRKGMDPFRAKGQLSLELGFMVGLITESTPDDDEKLAALVKAADKQLGVRIVV
jgi:hypothetical protein